MATYRLKRITDERKTLNLKVTREEKAKLQERADKYTEGNLSLWLRYAGINLTPKNEDVERVRKA